MLPSLSRSLLMLKRQGKKKIFWVGCFGFNGPFRQYFSLYRVVSQREGERGERQRRVKMSKQPPTRTYCKRNRPLPYYHPNCRTPRHWKFTQHHRTTRPPQVRNKCQNIDAVNFKKLDTLNNYRSSSVIRWSFFFSFQNDPKNLDQAYKMDLDL